MKMNVFHVAAITACCTCAPTMAGSPTISETGWSLIAEIPTDAPRSPRFHPLDGSIIFVSDGAADGLYRVEQTQPFPIRLQSQSQPFNLLIDPADGDIFVAYAVGGTIRRYDWSLGTDELWVQDFAAGDDDPNGMAIAPMSYTGPLVTPGTAVAADQGFNGPDGVWSWSTATPNGEALILDDTQIFTSALDVTFTDTNMYIADSDGGLFTVDAMDNAVAFSTSQTFVTPFGIATDPISGDLFVHDDNDGTIWRVDPTDGSSTLFLSGLMSGSTGRSPIGFSADGRQIVVADYLADEIYVFANCDTILDPIEDCNNNGIRDICEFDGETLFDCNNNGIADSCEIAEGLAEDCNLDGIPDDCPQCPPVDIVFVMDTSSSMNDEAAVICASISALATSIANQGIDLSADYLGISDNPGGSFGCLTDNVISLLGTTVPGMPPAGTETLGDCPGGNEVASEDWARATSVVAGLYPWRSNALRIVVPISDEGAWCGDPTNNFDDLAVFHAIDVALANGVIVSPIVGTGGGSAVIQHAELLADATGGQWTQTTDPDQDLFDAINGAIVDACLSVNDCNGNGIPDECDIASGFSIDMEPDGIPDECQLPDDCDGNGVPDVVDIFNGDLEDCNNNAIWDECEITFGLVPDCNNNMVPDSCDIVFEGYVTALFENTTGAADSTFVGAPDGTFFGLGGQIVTYDLTAPPFIVDGPGSDFNVYEVASGGNEFSSIVVSVSENGVDFFSVEATESAWVPIDGDEAAGNPAGFTRSYDIGGVGLATVNYIRIDGNGDGAAGTSTGFDLDAIGIINALALNDTNMNGVPDECDCPGDTNGDGMVDFTDLNAVLGNWNQSVPPGTMGDIDGNGQVDFADLNAVLANWGTSC